MAHWAPIPDRNPAFSWTRAIGCKPGPSSTLGFKDEDLGFRDEDLGFIGFRD